MKLNFKVEYDLDLPDCKFDSIICIYTKLMPLLLADLFQIVLNAFGREAMSLAEKPFCCEKCGNDTYFIWKTRHGKETVLQTIFGKIKVRQLQVKCKNCDTKKYITRDLLGLNKWMITPPRTRRMLALIGSLMPFRVAEKITTMFGVNLCRMSVWRSVQLEAEEIEFGLDPDGLPAGEADGTGIPTVGIKKRGRELKVFVQKKAGGGIRLAGLSIGKYDSGWDKLFQPLMSQFASFNQFLLVTDGDTNILKSLGDKVRIIYQRCLWHIPHQLKHYLWQDEVKHKSKEWLNVMCKTIEICTVKYMPYDDCLLTAMVNNKRQQLQDVIGICLENGYNKCGVYLKNAAPDMFSSIEKKLQGKTTSLVERVMRIVNFRIKVGKWSEKGALNVNKVRQAHYYNGFDVPKFNSSGITVSRTGDKTAHHLKQPDLVKKEYTQTNPGFAVKR